jgi:glycosyltransferase involved in cell wall biosynthesis
MSIKPLLLAKRWAHHTPSGGYDRICRELGFPSVFVHKKKYVKYYNTIRRRFKRHLIPSSHFVNTYGFADLMGEMNVFYKTRKFGFSLVHSIYAEDQLHLLLDHRKKLPAALVGTFHLPLESVFIQKVVGSGFQKRFRNIDAAIVVSRSMIGDCEDWLGKGNVFFVPHGIDTTTFCPFEGISEKFNDNSLNVLSVGIHGRDWDTVMEVTSQFTENRNIKFSAIVPGKIRHRFKDNPEIQLYSEIPENELIKKYQAADILLIPLKFATANNSLLESIACGTPVISTKTGGIPDYLTESSGWMFDNGDNKSIVQLLNRLTENKSVLRDKSEHARKESLQFDWQAIVHSTYDVYTYAFEKWQRGKS